MRRYFMVNGPLGGNMGTPPVEPQPPQVSFTTTAESRGGFNNFLKSIPQTTAMTPIPPLGSAPTAPMSNPMGNIDIFNQPPSMGMGMMGMNQPQMNPMMQQPMQTPMQQPMMGGLMGKPIQNFFDGGGVDDSDFGGFSDYGSVDATSDDGFSEDNDVSDYSTDDSGVYTGDNSSNMGLDDDVVAQNIIQNALNEGINQSTTQDSGSNNVNIAPRINSQIMGSEEDIFQDGINRDIAGSLTNREAANMMPNASNFGSRAAPNIAGAFRGGNNASLLGPEDALIDAITKGKSDLYAPFTNNPGNLKQAREDLTTETIKGFNADGTPRTGPALFNTLEAGQKALDDQLSSYGNRGINTATDFVNTYLGTDIKENPLENKQGYLSAVNNAVGSNFDLSNAATRGNLMNAIARQELGQKGINALNNQVTTATGLDLTSLSPSNTRDIVDDAYTTDVPQVRTSITPDVVGSTNAELNAMDRAITNTQRANEIQNQLANVNDQTLADRLQNQRGLDRNISTIPDTALETMIDRRDIFQPDNIGTGQQRVDTSLENMAGRRDVLPDQVFDINTNVVDRNPDLDALRSRGTPVDTIFDIDTTDTRNFVGDDAFDDSTFIENPSNMVEAGGMGIPAPKEFKDPFPNAGIGSIPTLTSLANKFSAYSRGRVLDSIAQKGYTPVYDGDVIVGAKNKSGQLMEGMDPNAPMDTGNDNNENPLILRPIAKAEEEKVEEEKLPNVIGGGETPAPVSSGSVVVDSPFTSNVGNFIPSSFNTGELNKLIEALTGVASPRAMKQGGVARYAEGGRVMQALDNLLATG
jgi:hypothetical protein